MDFDAEDVEELDAALVGVSWSDIHVLKCNPSVGEPAQWMWLPPLMSMVVPVR
jgi:hypothetical protein